MAQRVGPEDWRVAAGNFAEDSIARLPSVAASLQSDSASAHCRSFSRAKAFRLCGAQGFGGQSSSCWARPSDLVRIHGSSMEGKVYSTGYSCRITGFRERLRLSRKMRILPGAPFPMEPFDPSPNCSPATRLERRIPRRAAVTSGRTSLS